MFYSLSLSLSLSLYVRRCIDFSSFFFFPKDKFFSRLTGAHISDEDYRHAQEVCVHARARVCVCVCRLLCNFEMQM